MTTQPEGHRKVHEDSPDRCTAVMGSMGQCRNVKVPGCDFCITHTGYKQDNKNKAEIHRNYRLAKFQARVGEFADSPVVKNLREEVGICRMVLEEIMGKCNDATDLLMYSERISKILTQIQGLVLACQKLEEKSGNLLDKTQLFVISEKIVGIISDHVSDPDALELIAHKLLEMLTTSTATNPLG